MAISARPIQSTAVGVIAAAPSSSASAEGFDHPVHTPIGPTRPQVPMPEDTAAPFISSLNRQVATGPVTALAAMAGIHIFGLRTMLPICSIEVPSPCETTPPQPFSLNETTAKPTMFAQQPARAAPPARPVRLRAAQIAAEDIGSVRAMPTMTETSMPITNGC